MPSSPYSLQRIILRTWSMSLIDCWTSISHIRYTYLESCPTIQKSGTWNKVLHPIQLCDLKILCKRYDECISTSIFKKWGGLKRECVMNRFSKLDCAKKNLLFGVVLN